MSKSQNFIICHKSNEAEVTKSLNDNGLHVKRIEPMRTNDYANARKKFDNFTIDKVNLHNYIVIYFD